ncbi:hypothetical protein KKE92_03545 [Candidatus Micrarchaeota archaeon]|nr:hypothetical protein [Candidatus Micrarchaeota archaeon]
MSLAKNLPSGRNVPKQLHAQIARWSATYQKFGGQDAVPHVLRVLDSSIKHSVVEPEKIGNIKKDPKQLNLQLASVILAHVFRRNSSNKADFPTEDFARFPYVMEGFNTFNALRNNDLSNQDPDEYKRLLAEPSLGLLARMIDLPQYGMGSHRSEGELRHLNPGRFYVFDGSHGKSEYELIGEAAKKVYSPLADLLGYRTLAGQLYQLYYYHVDKSTYDAVIKSLFQLELRIAATSTLCDYAISLLSYELQHKGYKFSINRRLAKHPGKVMEKTDRYSRESGRKIPDIVSNLNDLVAFTVVLRSRNGKLITQNDVHEFEDVARIIVKIVSSLHPISHAGRSNMFTDMVTHPKPNGYQSFHVDMPLEGTEVVNLEAIVRNGRMEEYSKTGGAAHYLYKGGGDLARSVSNAYHGIMDAMTGKSKVVSDSVNQRMIKVKIDGTIRQRMVDQRACVGEALICADVDLSNGLILKPKISLLAPIKGIDTLNLEHAPVSGQLLSRTMVQLLLEKSVTPHAREKLLAYLKQC